MSIARLFRPFRQIALPERFLHGTRRVFLNVREVAPRRLDGGFRF